MRMNPPFHQEPLNVMSTDDSDVLPGPPTSTDLSVNTSVTSSTSPTITMKPQVTTTVVSSSQTLENSVDTTITKGASQVSPSSLSESNEDSKMTRFKVMSVDALSLGGELENSVDTTITKRASQASLSSLSESNEDSKMTRFKVMSVDGELGDRRDHANSAFEIMSVVTDLDSSSAHTRQPTSADDSLRNISKLESGSEEDATSLSEANRIDSMVSSDVPLSADPSTFIQENHLDPNNANMVGNGSNVPPGPSRFKRLNLYERGRWIIKDYLANMEESQKDPKNPQKVHQGGSVIGALLPVMSQKSSLPDDPEPPFSTAGDLSSGSGMLSDMNSEKDSVIERSSTAAESTLSRRSSMSSLLHDEHDVESVASASGSTAGRDRDTPEITQLPVPATQQASTTSAAAATVTMEHTNLSSRLPFLMTPSLPATAIPSVSVTSSGVSTMAPTSVSTPQMRDEPHVSGAVGVTHGPSCSCEACTESREKEPAASKPKEARPLKASVKHAMSHLQSELEQLLQNLDVDKQNPDLIEENRLLKEDNQRLKEDNAKLKHELAGLRLSLTKLLNPADDSAGNNTSQQHSLS